MVRMKRWSAPRQTRIGQGAHLPGAGPGSEEYDAKVKVMPEYVKGRSDVAAALRSMKVLSACPQPSTTMFITP